MSNPDITNYFRKCLYRLILYDVINEKCQGKNTQLAIFFNNDMYITEMRMQSCFIIYFCVQKLSKTIHT